MEAISKEMFEQKRELSEEDLSFFRRSIFERAGINITAQKRELVRSRIVKRLRELNFSGFSEYRRLLEEAPEDDPEWDRFVNALTTNKTEWFRESSHFFTLRDKVLPALEQEGAKKIKIWCCASSTGEEAYGLAFVCAQALKNADFEIHASDIDTETLARAKAGVYRKHLALGQTPEEYHCYFDRGEGAIEDWVRVNKRIKQKIVFFQKNLLEKPEETGTFDIVFCRNVLIYFQPATIEQVMKNLYFASKDKALLFIGHSESLQNLNTDYRYKNSSIYIKGRKFGPGL